MHEKCCLCWGVPVVVGGWVCKPNLVFSMSKTKLSSLVMHIAAYYSLIHHEVCHDDRNYFLQTVQQKMCQVQPLCMNKLAWLMPWGFLPRRAAKHGKPLISGGTLRTWVAEKVKLQSWPGHTKMTGITVKIGSSYARRYSYCACVTDTHFILKLDSMYKQCFNFYKLSFRFSF